MRGSSIIFLISLILSIHLIDAQAPSSAPSSAASSPLGGFGFGLKEEDPSRITVLQQFLQNNMAHHPGIELSSSTSLGASYYAAEILEALQPEAKIINQSVFSPIEYTYTLSNLLAKFQVPTGGFLSTLSVPPPPPPTANPSASAVPTASSSTVPASNDSIPTVANTYFALRLLSVSEAEDLRHAHSDSVHRKLGLVPALSFLHSSLSAASSENPEGLYTLYPGSSIVTSTSLYHGQTSFSILSKHLSPADITSYPPPNSDTLLAFISSLYHSGAYESSGTESGKKREVGGFSFVKGEKELSLKATFESLSVLKASNLLEKFFQQNPNAKDQIKTFVFAHRDEKTAAFSSSSAIVSKTFSGLTSRLSSLSLFSSSSSSTPDVLSTLHALEILNVLNSLDYYLNLGANRQKLLDFLLSLQRADGGFALTEVSRISSYENTLAAVKCLALSSQLKYLYQRTPLNPPKLNTQPLPAIVVYLWALLLIVIFSAVLYFFTSSPSDNKKSKKNEDQDDDDDDDEEDEDEDEGDSARNRKRRRENRVISVVQDLKTGGMFDIDGKNISDEGLLSNMNDWEILEKDQREGLVRYRLKLKDSHHQSAKKPTLPKRTKKGR